ncbi:MAG: lysophospholipid acyltransferase family protein [bacterium]|nr:lysophospholipid acyltransferase family protein [bacterium]
MKWDRFIDALIPPIASLVIKVIGWTLRLEIAGGEHLQPFKDRKLPVLFAFWHNRLLYTCYYLRKEGLTMMISQSRDGELIARVARYFGIDATRGSSSRQGLRAVAQLARVMAEGRNGGITPDGPRGPLYRLQMGVLLAARKAQVPVLPVSINFSRMKVFRSWDRFRFPYPFSRAVLVYGPPFPVPADAQGEKMEQLRGALEARLKEVTESSDRYFD